LKITSGEHFEKENVVPLAIEEENGFIFFLKATKD
jgi:hypothetical protein